MVDTPDVREKSAMMTKKREFTREFRAEAVRLVLEQKQPVTNAARDLGVSISALSKWVRQAKVEAGRGPAGALTTEERTELAQLRREVRTLRMEREILKKATAFFAKENT